MIIPRFYQDLNKWIQPGKVLVMFGARRVGKTTLIQEFLKKTSLKYKLDSGENIQTQNVLSSQDFTKILSYAEGYELLVLDEAQNIPNVGKGLKILVDNIPTLAIVATGSSSFELAGQIGEPLTGRKKTLTLFPLAQMELVKIHNSFELTNKLHDYLVFGEYPEVIQANTKQEKIDALAEIVNSYLLKDILALENVKNSKTLLSILKLLAFQIGSQVSLNEIANNVNIDVKTVQRYLDLLEKAFVIQSINGYSTNLRSEVTSKAKYYFLDNGLRNGIIQQFNALDLRNDIGQLWENFVFIERRKYLSYKNLYGNTYFWRTYEQQEVDIVEERDGELFGFECKWSGTKKVKAPSYWRKKYPKAHFSVITQENYLDFVT